MVMAPVRPSYFAWIAGIAAALVAACGIQPAALSPESQAHRLQTAGAVPAAQPTATDITFGDSIGTAAWKDGDVGVGGLGQHLDGIICRPVMDTSFHIHIHLDIYDAAGDQLQLPWGIGIVKPWGLDALHNAVLRGHCYYDLHTHDHDNVIHYESPDDMSLTLGNFFDVWGVPLSRSQVSTLQGTVYSMYGTLPPSELHWSSTVDPRTIPLVEHEFVYLAVGNIPPSPLPVYHWSY